MKRKIFYLFLALVLPGLIFIFLKRFGKNEFAIPVYYQKGVDSLNTACGTKYAQPYHLQDSIVKRTGWQTGRPCVFLLGSVGTNGKELRRLSGTFDPLDFQVIEIGSFNLGAITFERWRSCVFMCRKAFNAVLVDKEKRIRGYYSIGKLEETDRLIMEMQILLGKY